MFSIPFGPMAGIHSSHLHGQVNLSDPSTSSTSYRHIFSPCRRHSISCQGQGRLWYAIGKMQQYSTMVHTGLQRKLYVANTLASIMIKVYARRSKTYKKRGATNWWWPPLITPWAMTRNPLDDQHLRSPGKNCTRTPPVFIGKSEIPIWWGLVKRRNP